MLGTRDFSKRNRFESESCSSLVPKSTCKSELILFVFTKHRLDILYSEKLIFNCLQQQF